MIQDVSGRSKPSSSRSRGQHAHACAKIHNERVGNNPMPNRESVCTNPGHARMFPMMSDRDWSSRSLSRRDRTATRIERSFSPGTCEQSRTKSPCRRNADTTRADFNLAGNSRSRKLAAEGKIEQPGNRSSPFANRARSCSMNRRLRQLCRQSCNAIRAAR